MGYDIERMKEGKKNVMNAISGTKGGREKKKKKIRVNENVCRVYFAEGERRKKGRKKKKERITGIVGQKRRVAMIVMMGRDAMR